MYTVLSSALYENSLLFRIIHRFICKSLQALALAREADYVVLGLGIETCGMNPAHNLNPHAHGGKLGW